MELENTAIRLKRIMQERNLRQVDLLEMVKPFCEKYNVKINKSDISQYLSGKVKPGQEKLSMLGMALGVTESWLMGYDSPKEKSNCIKTLTLSREEKQLLENFNKLNNLGKKEANKRVAELSYMPMYCDNEISATAYMVAEKQATYNTNNEISATKDNVIEFNTKDNKKDDEVFVPYTSLDQAGTTIAAHDDDLTDEEKAEMDRIILEDINEERLREWNKKHNK